jgi:hypothetical protein
MLVGSIGALGIAEAYIQRLDTLRVTGEAISRVSGDGGIPDLPSDGWRGIEGGDGVL